MKDVIVGTAGHIDHGKSALVRALTGTDPDRLEEEKRRGITIDLGFAHLESGGTRFGFIDVPGHERFVKNMLAGVGGIDILLFVVSAEESIKPQTREHFDICRLLGIERGIIALTKCDLVDADLAGLVQLETEELVRGSFLEGAPVVPVSAKTGAGLEALRRELASAAAQAPVRPRDGGFRMPIDRVFTLRGFGTVVTGTCISGSVAREAEVEVHPLGRVTRVRNVQVYGEGAARASAGQRSALNVPDLEPQDLARGMVLATPGLYADTRTIDCRIQLLAAAKPLKHRAPVHFHAGSAEIVAEVRLHDGAAVLQPGGSSYARIVLREPALLVPGDRFIIRQFSPVVTIGGGQVLDTAGIKLPSGESALARMRVLETGSLADRTAVFLSETRFGLSPRELAVRSGQSEAAILKACGDPRFRLFREPQPWILPESAFREAGDRIFEAAKRFHAEQPLAPGISKQDLRSSELPGAPAFLLDALLAVRKTLTADGDVVRLASHKLVLKEDEHQAREKMERAFEEAGLAVPSVSEVLSASGVTPARAQPLLQLLLKEKKLVRVSADLVFHQAAIDRLRELLSTRRGEHFTVGDFKDWTGISRKYAIPLLEFLDRERLTRRVGEERVVL